MIVDGNPLTLDVGAPIQNGTVMVLRNTLRGGVTGFPSDRAIAAKANVVIDLDAQGYDLGDSPQTPADMDRWSGRSPRRAPADGEPRRGR